MQWVIAEGFVLMVSQKVRGLEDAGRPKHLVHVEYAAAVPIFKIMGRLGDIVRYCNRLCLQSGWYLVVVNALQKLAIEDLLRCDLGFEASVFENPLPHTAR